MGPYLLIYVLINMFTRYYQILNDTPPPKKKTIRIRYPVILPRGSYNNTVENPFNTDINYQKEKTHTPSVSKRSSLTEVLKEP